MEIVQNSQHWDRCKRAPDKYHIEPSQDHVEMVAKF